jgi:hypothetical protein
VSLTHVVFVATAVWHALAAWHFILYPQRTLKRTTAERPPHALATELLRFLGGLNLALAFLGVAACFSPGATLLVAVTLAIANASQVAEDVRVHRGGVASGPFLMQIFVGDTVFTLANVAVAVAAVG